jgi:hypothetical protein
VAQHVARLAAERRAQHDADAEGGQHPACQMPCHRRGRGPRPVLDGDGEQGGGGEHDDGVRHASPYPIRHASTALARSATHGTMLGIPQIRSTVATPGPVTIAMGRSPSTRASTSARTPGGRHEGHRRQVDDDAVRRRRGFRQPGAQLVDVADVDLPAHHAHGRRARRAAQDLREGRHRVDPHVFFPPLDWFLDGTAAADQRNPTCATVRAPSRLGREAGDPQHARDG